MNNYTYVVTTASGVEYAGQDAMKAFYVRQVCLDYADHEWADLEVFADGKFLAKFEGPGGFTEVSQNE